MTDRYFEKFPKITYGNTQVVDITHRVAILESFSKNPYVFYPYDLTDNERADQLSNRYYNDPYKTWVVYLGNKIIDPYYEWYLTETQFNEFLSLKYGSAQHAFEKVKYYRNNWVGKDNLNVGGYDALPATTKKYWEPVYGSMNQILEYKRRQIDWIVNTNRIVQYVVGNSTFTNNEIVDIHFSSNFTGQGQFVYSTNTNIYVRHTNGVVTSNNTVIVGANSYIFGRESLVNTTFTSASLQIENLLPEEEVYFAPVYDYDYEKERNEFNKSVRLIDNRLTNKIVKDFRDLMKQ